MPVIVRSFLKWYQSASVDGRVEAVSAMAEAYLTGQLGENSAEEAEAALTLVLDDASPVVRRALAWALALSEKAPRHLLVGLAHDRPEVAGLVLARSPQLRDADLIDCVKTGDRLAHLAIAMRSSVSAEVGHALAGVAGGEALVALCQNPGADLFAQSFACMVERHPSDGALRDVLSRRDDLPSAVRQSLVASLSHDLLAMMGTTGWLEPGRASRLVTDTSEMASVRLALEAPDLGPFVEHLRATGQLTPSLLLRGLLCGDSTLFGAALATLTDLSPRRIAGILKGRGAPLLALYNKAGLPSGLYPAFEAGLAAIRELKLVAGEAMPVLSRPVIQSVLAACLQRTDAGLHPLLAMLRRFDAEAAREEARVLTADLMREDAPQTLDACVVPAMSPDDFIEALDHAPAGDEMIERVELFDLAGTDIDDAPAELVGEATVAQVMPGEFTVGAAVADEIAPQSVGESMDEAVSRFELRLRRLLTPEPRVAAPLPVAVDAQVADVRDEEATYHSELDALFAEAFAPAGAAPPAPSQGALRVIDRLADQLDESYFANWDIRRNAA